MDNRWIDPRSLENMRRGARSSRGIRLGNRKGVNRRRSREPWPPSYSLELQWSNPRVLRRLARKKGTARSWTAGERAQWLRRPITKTLCVFFWLSVSPP